MENLIRRKIDSNNPEFFIENARTYKKIDHLSLSVEEQGMKSYFSDLNLRQARIKFRERASRMKECKRHYSSDHNNIKSMFLCPCNSDKVDVLSHWKVCKLYEKFRESRDLNSDVDLISYYQDIIAARSSGVS